MNDLDDRLNTRVFIGLIVVAIAMMLAVVLVTRSSDEPVLELQQEEEQEEDLSDEAFSSELDKIMVEALECILDNSDSNIAMRTCNFIASTKMKALAEKFGRELPEGWEE
jgi:hypothetical protein